MKCERSRARSHEPGQGIVDFAGASRAAMIVAGGLLFLREALRGRRGERWSLYIGPWLFGLGWPLLLLWSLGVTDFRS